MRISTNSITQQGLEAMLRQQNELAKTQLQVSSGKRIQTPSDDPIGAVKMLDLQRQIGLSQQYQDNADVADSRLSTTDGTLKSAGVDPSSAACASVTGNSMEPVLLEGTTVGVDTSKTSIKDGDMYAIDHDGMLRIKLLYRMPGNSLKIVSYNKDEWPDELLAPDEAQKVRIIGRVFWWSTLR